MLITNPTRQPLEVELSFVAHSVAPRNLEIEARGVRLWAGAVAGPALLVRIPKILLPPGTTRVDFRTAEPLTPRESTDERLVSFQLQDLQVRLIPPPVGVATPP